MHRPVSSRRQPPGRSRWESHSLPLPTSPVGTTAASRRLSRQGRRGRPTCERLPHKEGEPSRRVQYCMLVCGVLRAGTRRASERTLIEQRAQIDQVVRVE
eukprot:scaffold84126_cov64-Phaeocystis_antarctica.AAC.1